MYPDEEQQISPGKHLPHRAPATKAGKLKINIVISGAGDCTDKRRGSDSERLGSLGSLADQISRISRISDDAQGPRVAVAAGNLRLVRSRPPIWQYALASPGRPDSGHSVSRWSLWALCARDAAPRFSDLSLSLFCVLLFSQGALRNLLFAFLAFHHFTALFCLGISRSNFTRESPLPFSVAACQLATLSVGPFTPPPPPLPSYHTYVFQR